MSFRFQNGSNSSQKTNTLNRIQGSSRFRMNFSFETIIRIESCQIIKSTQIVHWKPKPPGYMAAKASGVGGKAGKAKGAYPG